MLSLHHPKVNWKRNALGIKSALKEVFKISPWETFLVNYEGKAFGTRIPRRQDGLVWDLIWWSYSFRSDVDAKYPLIASYDNPGRANLSSLSYVIGSAKKVHYSSKMNMIQLDKRLSSVRSVGISIFNLETCLIVFYQLGCGCVYSITCMYYKASERNTRIMVKTVSKSEAWFRRCKLQCNCKKVFINKEQNHRRN